MPSVPPIFLGQVLTRKFFAFSGNSLLVYDYLLTLPLEMAHIWNEPWSAVNLFFVINRYGNLIGQTIITLEESGYLSHGSRRFCLAFELYCLLFVVFSGESIRLFVLMRACAIFGLRRSISLLAITLYILYAIGILVLSLYLFLPNIDLIPLEYLSEIGLCISPAPPKIWTIWFIPLFLDGFILAVVCYTLFRLINGSFDVYSSRILARDALLFYLATLFNVFFGVVCWTAYRQDPRNFLQELITYPVLSVVGQRLMLNLRRFRARVHSTRDLSQEVNRQIALMIELDQLETEISEG